MSTALHVDELKKHLLFADIPDSGLNELSQLLAFDNIPRSLEVIRYGDEIRVLWLLVSGQCEVVKPADNGNSRQLALLEPGSVFGELSFFDPAPHSASVRTVTDSAVAWLTHEAFVKLQTACPTTAHQITLNTSRVVAQRLRKMDEWICELLDDPAERVNREEWHEFRAKLYANWSF